MCFLRVLLWNVSELILFFFFQFNLLFVIDLVHFTCVSLQFCDVWIYFTHSTLWWMDRKSKYGNTFTKLNLEPRIFLVLHSFSNFRFLIQIQQVWKNSLSFRKNTIYDTKMYRRWIDLNEMQKTPAIRRLELNFRHIPIFTRNILFYYFNSVHFSLSLSLCLSFSSFRSSFPLPQQQTTKLIETVKHIKHIPHHKTPSASIKQFFTFQSRCE